MTLDSFHVKISLQFLADAFGIFALPDLDQIVQEQRKWRRLYSAEEFHYISFLRIILNHTWINQTTSF